MDVKSAFLNGYINELVYVEQPPGLEDEPCLQVEKGFVWFEASTKSMV
jgi:hypothetical protein